MITYLVSELSAASMPSLRLVPSVAPSWRMADGPWAGKAMTVAPSAARKRTAPSGAPAYAHEVCAAQHTIQVSGEKSVLQAATVESLGNGITFATQLSADVTRVDGRAGSPPRGTPV
ncbi:hypothetical protein SAMN05443668_10590 [Cryptosporangium aurantiacum]|uniref:Uncharacterized protein n=1 Tax=Cryptosporangium aurantiacum TaxID=134849 RepID=A0A1M7QN23_9ACTN|nr:hypothetical protein SAMN05443668_10590 [Cryptosporangium aurantiacum]